MINLKSDPKAKHDDPASVYSDPDEPAYPYGLELCLCDDVMKRLGITNLPAVGSTVRIVAMATVTSVSAYEEAKPDENGSKIDRSVRLQITDMDPPKASSSMFENSSMNP